MFTDVVGEAHYWGEDVLLQEEQINQLIEKYKVDELTIPSDKEAWEYMCTEPSNEYYYVIGFTSENTRLRDVRLHAFYDKTYAKAMFSSYIKKPGYGTRTVYLTKLKYHTVKPFLRKARY